MTNRAALNEIPVDSVLPLRPETIVVTMSAGQWDLLLEGSYEMGYILLELDEKERPVRAYQRQAS